MYSHMALLNDISRAAAAAGTTATAAASPPQQSVAHHCFKLESGAKLKRKKTKNECLN